MDTDKLVDQIVEQVLGRLGPPAEGRGLRRVAVETGVTATGRVLGDQAATTGRVLDDGREHLYGRGTGDGIGRRRVPGGSVTAPSVGDGAPTGLVRPYLASEFSGRSVAAGVHEGVLAILTAGDGKLDEVYRQLSELSEKGRGLSLYLSPSARKVLDLGALRQACPSATMLPDEVTFQMRDLVEAAQALVFPNLTLSTASKIAHLDGDSAASLLAIFALMRAKPVFACTDSVFGIRPDYPGVPAGFKSKVDEIVSALQGLGVQVVGLERLADSVASGRAVAAVNGAGGGSGLQSAPRADTGAPTGSFVDASGVLRTPMATGPCEGDPDKCTGCGQCAEKNEPAVRTLASSGADRIGASLGTKVLDKSIARLIDHTLLKPDATEQDIIKLCQEARQFSFASVCINPSYVPLAAKQLEGSPVKVCTVIGFPLGATTPTTKAIETRDAIANGANEIDMVINVGALKSANDDLVRRDIEAVVGAAKGQALVKVILETALLSKEEIVKACLLAKMAGADFVKTSTGFGPGGAKVEDVALMRQTVGSEMGVKASGGIRDLETAQAMVEAGATRIGASASVAIAKGESAGPGTY